MPIPFVDIRLNLQVYRVRFVEEELPNDKKISISEYAYNPILEEIKRKRLNLPNEQVLYTSTHPLVAYKETVTSESSKSYFYLSVWHKNDKDELCSCFLSSFESCSQCRSSNANKIYRLGYQNFDEQDLQTIAKIGKVLEKYYPSDSNDKYEDSSQLASKLLEQADCIMTPSAKDNKEINITYNKRFTDNSLVLDRVYFCRKFNSLQKSLAFDVEKIGVVSGNKVVWYNWFVKENTLRNDCKKTFKMNPEEEQTILVPNITTSTSEWQKGIYKGECVEFKLDLVPEVK